MKPIPQSVNLMLVTLSKTTQETEVIFFFFPLTERNQLDIIYLKCREMEGCVKVPLLSHRLHITIQ